MSTVVDVTVFTSQINFQNTTGCLIYVGREGLGTVSYLGTPNYMARD